MALALGVCFIKCHSHEKVIIAYHIIVSNL